MGVHLTWFDYKFAGEKHYMTTQMTTMSVLKIMKLFLIYRFHVNNLCLLILYSDSSSDHKIQIKVVKLSTPSTEETLEESLEDSDSDSS